MKSRIFHPFIPLLMGGEQGISRRASPEVTTYTRYMQSEQTRDKKMARPVELLNNRTGHNGLNTSKPLDREK